MQGGRRRGPARDSAAEQRRVAAFQERKSGPLAQFWHGVGLIPERRQARKLVRLRAVTCCAARFSARRLRSSLRLPATAGKP